MRCYATYFNSVTRLLFLKNKVEILEKFNVGGIGQPHYRAMNRGA